MIVATGAFTTPNNPNFQGFDKFKGRIVHSHDVRDFNDFIDKRVLIVGSSLSGEDMALQCYKYGAKQITVCYRQKEWLD